MKYLLDVNALLALGFANHEFHARTERWIITLLAGEAPELLTCPITELGFVRVASSVAAFGATVSDARTLLARMKSGKRIRIHLIPDDLGSDRLPAWVKSPKQTTDGHLAELAKSHRAAFVTLDEGIPGAMVIPR